MRSGRHGIITVTRERSGPGQWTVRHWGHGVSSNKIVTTRSFAERPKAVAFARGLQRDCGAGDMIVRRER
jgi:hypothetical protein